MQQTGKLPWHSSSASGNGHQSILFHILNGTAKFFAILAASCATGCPRCGGTLRLRNAHVIHADERGLSEMQIWECPICRDGRSMEKHKVYQYAR